MAFSKATPEAFHVFNGSVTISDALVRSERSDRTTSLKNVKKWLPNQNIALFYRSNIMTVHPEKKQTASQEVMTFFLEIIFLIRKKLGTRKSGPLFFLLRAPFCETITGDNDC